MMLDGDCYDSGCSGECEDCTLPVGENVIDEEYINALKAENERLKAIIKDVARKLNYCCPVVGKIESNYWSPHCKECMEKNNGRCPEITADKDARRSITMAAGQWKNEIQEEAK